MKSLKRLFFSLDIILLTFLVLYTATSFAQVSAVSPTDFLSQVLDFIKSFGGLAKVMKIAGVITLLISSMKVTALNDLIWSKLGAAQAWMGPAMGLIAGLLGLGQSAPISLASVFAYVSAGAGAIILHELLDSAKSIKGIGPMVVSVINIIETILGGPAAQPPQPPQAPKA